MNVSLFGDLSLAQFLNVYWRKEPLFVRSAFSDDSFPVDAQALIMLSMRDDADSRIILEQGGEYPWEAIFGPFEQEDYAQLPETHWTLLVQEVDRLVPGIARILDPFTFLPNWRFDDIMVSYATDHGGVGAHIDNYDVFLIQGHGRRRWQISKEAIQEENVIPDLDVRILSDFKADQEWIVEPGDLLYLPPRFAHRGIAMGECVTYSIGCRAPSAAELVGGYLEQVMDAQSNEPFSGRLEVTSDDPGRIAPELKAFARDCLKKILADEDALERWVGQFLSQPSRGWNLPRREKPLTLPELLDALENGNRLLATTPSQVLYDRLSNDTLVLYAGGEAYPVDADLETQVSALTDRSGIGQEALHVLVERASFAGLIMQLTNDGYFQLA